MVAIRWERSGPSKTFRIGYKTTKDPEDLILPPLKEMMEIRE